jgi:hypothetical protein
MRLSELGEFGLLGELERHGLAQEIANDAAELAGPPCGGGPTSGSIGPPGATSATRPQPST